MSSLAVQLKQAETVSQELQRTIDRRDHEISDLLVDKGAKDRRIANLESERAEFDEQRHILVQSLTKYKADWKAAQRLNDEYVAALPDPDHPPLNVAMENYIGILQYNKKNLQESIDSRELEFGELKRADVEQHSRAKKTIRAKDREIKSLQSLVKALRESADTVREHNTTLINRDIEQYAPVEQRELIAADVEKCKYAYKLLRERLLQARESVNANIQTHEERAEKAESSLEKCKAELEYSEEKVRELDDKVLNQEIEIETHKRDNMDSKKNFEEMEEQLQSEFREMAQRYNRLFNSLPERRFQQMVDFLGQQNVNLSAENRRLTTENEHLSHKEQDMKSQPPTDMHYSIIFQHRHDEIVKRLSRAEALLKQHGIDIPYLPKSHPGWTVEEKGAFDEAVTKADPTSPKPDYDSHERRKNELASRKRLQLTHDKSSLVPMVGPEFRIEQPSETASPMVNLPILKYEPPEVLPDLPSSSQFLNASGYISEDSPEDGREARKYHIPLKINPDILSDTIAPPGLIRSPNNMANLLGIIGASPISFASKGPSAGDPSPESISSQESNSQISNQATPSRSAADMRAARRNAFILDNEGLLCKGRAVRKVSPLTKELSIDTSHSAANGGSEDAEKERRSEYGSCSSFVNHGLASTANEEQEQDFITPDYGVAGTPESTGTVLKTEVRDCSDEAAPSSPIQKEHCDEEKFTSAQESNSGTDSTDKG